MAEKDPFVEKMLLKVREREAFYADLHKRQETAQINNDVIMGCFIGFGIGMAWAMIGLFLFS